MAPLAGGVVARVSAILIMFPLYREQVWELTVASLKTRYRNSITGFFWVLLNPILLLGVQAYVFGLVLRIDIDKYYLYLLAGLMPWIFLVRCVEMGTPVISERGKLIKSFPINPLTFVLVQVLDNAFNSFIAFFLLVVPFAIYHDILLQVLILAPVCYVLIIFSAFSLTWFLSSLNVLFRDTRYISQFIVNLAFFLTPIFYPPGLVPENLVWIIFFNPFYYMIHPFQVAIHDFSMVNFLTACQFSFVMGVLFFSLALLLWVKKKNAIYNDL